MDRATGPYLLNEYKIWMQKAVYDIDVSDLGEL